MNWGSKLFDETIFPHRFALHMVAINYICLTIIVLFSARDFALCGSNQPHSCLAHIICSLCNPIKVHFDGICFRFTVSIFIHTGFCWMLMHIYAHTHTNTLTSTLIHIHSYAQMIINLNCARLRARDNIFVVIRLTAPITCISPTTKSKWNAHLVKNHFFCLTRQYIANSWLPTENDTTAATAISKQAICSYLYSFDWFFWSVCRSIFVTVDKLRKHKFSTP